VKVNIHRKSDNSSRQQLYHPLRNTFRDYKTCSEAGGRHFKTCIKHSELNCGSKINSIFPVDAGFICNKEGVHIFSNNLGTTSKF
jgi:hypothetical protein